MMYTGVLKIFLGALLGFYVLETEGISLIICADTFLFEVREKTNDY